MATKLKNTSSAKKTSNKSKSLKRSMRKNGSGVSQRFLHIFYYRV